MNMWGWKFEARNSKFEVQRNESAIKLHELHGLDSHLTPNLRRPPKNKPQRRKERGGTQRGDGKIIDGIIV
jgi:hypothetical protein